MPDQITVTGTVGPAIALTAKVFTNVIDLDFQTQHGVLTIRHNYPNVKVTDIDLYLIATVTYTISAHVATVTVSS